MKVFVAEESQKLRKLLVRLITHCEELEVCGDEGDAHTIIQSIRKAHPDVVLLSMRLFGGTPMDVLKNIRMNEAGPQIILLVDQHYPEGFEHFKKYGIKYIFNKSLELQEMVQTLKKLSGDCSIKPV